MSRLFLPNVFRGMLNAPVLLCLLCCSREGEREERNNIKKKRNSKGEKRKGKHGGASSYQTYFVACLALRCCFLLVRGSQPHTWLRHSARHTCIRKSLCRQLAQNGLPGLEVARPVRPPKRLWTCRPGLPEKHVSMWPAPLATKICAGKSREGAFLGGWFF